MEYSPKQILDILNNLPKIKLHNISNNKYTDIKSISYNVNDIGYRYSFSINNKFIISQLVPSNYNRGSHGYINAKYIIEFLNDDEKEYINYYNSINISVFTFFRFLELINLLIKKNI